MGACRGKARASAMRCHSRELSSVPFSRPAPQQMVVAGGKALDDFSRPGGLGGGLDGRTGRVEIHHSQFGPVDLDAAIIGILQTAEELDECALPGAVQSHHSGDTPGRDLQIEIAHSQPGDAGITERDAAKAYRLA